MNRRETSAMRALKRPTDADSRHQNVDGRRLGMMVLFELSLVLGLAAAVLLLLT